MGKLCQTRTVPRVIVLMGVAGAGKTTIGRMLAESSHRDFLDADDLHPPGNRAKMQAGIPLTDEDRVLWLHAVRKWIEETAAAKRDAVVACSALKVSYRRFLLESAQSIVFVFLRISEREAVRRLSYRSGHFFGPALAKSQFDTLESPSSEPSLTVDAGLPPRELVETICRRLQLPRKGA